MFETFWVLAITALLGFALLGFFRACSREGVPLWDRTLRLLIVLTAFFILVRIAGSLVAGS